MKTLTVPGGHIAYDVSGVGPSTIVWVHGMPLDSRSWRDQLAHFDAKARNVTLDLRGYGQSGKLPPGTTDVTGLYAADLQALYEELGLTDTLLVGFASGGHVALRYAASHPGQVTRLVTINGSPQFRRSADWPHGFTDEQITGLLSHVDGVEALTDIVLNPEMVFQDVSPERGKELWQRFRPMGLNAGLETLMGFFDSISHDDDRHLLPGITAETLIVVGNIGREVSSEVGRYMRDKIPRSHLAELPGVDHFAFATRPALVNSLVEQLL